MKLITDRARAVDIDDFLALPLFGHLATASPDGPRESPVWFLWEDDCFWIIGSMRDDTFPHRLQRDGRCALGVVNSDVASGLVQHVGVRGHATVEQFDAARAERLLRRYLGDKQPAWNKRFGDTLTDPDNVLIRLVPQTVVARDVSYAANEDLAIVPETGSATGSPEGLRLLDLAERFYRAFLAGDGRALAELVSADVEWIVPLETDVSGVHRGPSGIVSLRRRVSDLTAGTWRPLRDDSFDIATSAWHAVIMDRFLATREDRRLDSHEAVALAVRDGRITRIFHYVYDANAFAAFWRANADQP